MVFIKLEPHSHRQSIWPVSTYHAMAILAAKEYLLSAMQQKNLSGHVAHRSRLWNFYLYQIAILVLLGFNLLLNV